ncbi:hypothetical protein EIN_065480 [Entamoeba invadens IP1]|uniref:Major facilitator superfamily (MFS) profile domain-containing protein n=1 Tax=Entamoeba invadens IP1 TaxID=370355 RepID=A0A0A1U064_ENTIV|nr:hypothetical protein EIN_065480 [Entamoeba invadens IP1]ELP84283.1 hypothetical protein EIN_065480 [Entamoeba invadens IP1]|eukprot:XP_004183629.1 hypothetical protein EIN_065480 [Entamoeba invadens IP1]
MNFFNINADLKKKILHTYNLTTYCVSAFCLNFSVYFFWLIIPIMMRDLGASPMEIGLVAAVAFTAQGFMAPVCGRLADKLPPETMARFGACLHCLTSLIIAMVYITETKTIPIYFICLIQSLGLAMYWSPTEALVGNESYAGGESKNISMFSMSFACGKAVGFLSAGTLYGLIGQTYSLYLACAEAFLLFFIITRFPQNNHLKEETVPEINIELEALPQIEKKEREYTTEIQMTGDPKTPVVVTEQQDGVVLSESQTPRISEEKGEAHIDLSVIKHTQVISKRPIHYFWYYINSIVFHCFVTAIVGVISNQYINYAKRTNVTLPGIIEDSDVLVGILLFIVNISQLFAYLILGRITIWQYKLTLNLISLAIILGCVMVFYFVKNGYVLAIASAVIGLLSGYDFQLNMFYSLNASESEKGKYMGISECSSCLSYSLAPLLAGLLSTYITLEWCMYTSFIYCILGLIGCAAIQGYVYYIERKDRLQLQKELKIPADSMK